MAAARAQGQIYPKTNETPSICAFEPGARTLYVVTVLSFNLRLEAWP